MSYEFGFNKGIGGVVFGIVTHNKHPTGDYMVRCKFPWIKSADDGDPEDFLTTWCPVVTPMAGGGRGFYCLPEVDDMVIVAFVHGAVHVPVVLGALWNSTDKAPQGDDAPADTEDPMGNKAGIADAATDTTDDKNNNRSFVSRAGSIMMFDDTEGKEKIIFKTPKGSTISINDELDVLAFYDHAAETYLILDAKNKQITLECTNGGIDVLCKNGTFNLEAKEITTAAVGGNVDHTTDGTWAQHSDKQMDIDAGGTLTETAPKIDMNP